MRSFVWLFSLGVAFAGSVGADDVVRMSEPVAEVDGYEVFGAPMESLEAGRTLADLIAHREELAGKSVSIRTNVAQVCQKKGCFFIARDGDYVARVKFADYGFFIPTDSSGKDVVLNGILELQEVSNEEKAHYAADLGEPEPAAAGTSIEYSIIATSVAVPLG